MQATNYAVEAEIEATHWWFVGRRRLFGRMIFDLGIASEAAILDIGSSTGTNLRLLKEIGFDNVIGLDASEESIRYCREKGLGEVMKGDICNLDFEDAAFSLVLATDVIEHVDDEAAALKEVARVLRPGGTALITVPAFPSLWGLQDEVSHHKRRYRKAELIHKIEAVGLRVEKAFYFNYLLFGPIWLARQVLRLSRIALASEGALNSPLINRLFTAVFDVDVATAPVLRPPFGVSALVITYKPDEAAAI